VVRKSRQNSSSAWKSAAAKRLLALAGNPETIDNAVRNIVESLLDDHEAIPVDVDHIAKRLEVEKIIEEDLPSSGELRRTNGALEIAYSSHLSPERRRFTIAHELGHAILERSGPGYPRFGKELERICDKLAAEILMPTRSFRRDCGNSFSLDKIFELANRYQTSLASTAIRYAELRKATVFAINDDIISWAFGEIRRGPIKRVAPTLREKIKEITIRQNGAETFLYNAPTWGGQWTLQGRQLGAKKAIFLFHPCYYRPQANAIEQ